MRLPILEKITFSLSAKLVMITSTLAIFLVTNWGVSMYFQRLDASGQRLIHLIERQRTLSQSLGFYGEQVFGQQPRARATLKQLLDENAATFQDIESHQAVPKVHQKDFARLQNLWSPYRQSAAKLLDEKLPVTEQIDALQQLRAQAPGLVEAHDSLAQDFRQYFQHVASRQGILRYVLLVLMGLFCVLMNSLLKNFVVVPIIQAQEMAEAVAKGNLGLSRPEKLLERNDELGTLGRSLWTMTQNLRDIIIQIRGNSDTVGNTSAHLRQASEAVNGMTEEVVGLMRELAGANENFCNRSAEVSDCISKTSTIAEEGRHNIQEICATMNEVKETTEEATSFIADLGKQSETIREIVDVISSISTQTNLLSLNATIEAARAGEKGKGFEVVADEVRNLAKQTKNASDQIEHLLEEIRGKIDHSIASIHQSVNKVLQGNEKVDSSLVAFQTIPLQVNHVATVFGDVRHLSKLSTQSAQRINISMSEVSERMTAIGQSAGTLQTGAKRLNDLTSRFSL